jgi:spore coat protein A, manganese oxidase
MPYGHRARAGALAHRSLRALVCAAALGGCGAPAPSEVMQPQDTPQVEPTPSLDPIEIPKFAQPLLIPPAMPPSAVANGVTEFRIVAAQFSQQVLPPPLPKTMVWGYGKDGDPSTLSYPAYTVETRSRQPVRVTWVNGLVDASGHYLKHLLPVDPTIHWADPGPQIVAHGDAGHGNHAGAEPSAPYTGPVPIVTHVHGAHSFDHSDGHPEAWFLPDAIDIPSGFAARGPHYRSQLEAGKGKAVFDYPLDEEAATLWYHDHSLGMTRLNVAAGLAGFWIVRSDAEAALNLPAPAPAVGDAPGTRYYEIPLVIQDRTFAPDGSLSYPSRRAQYDGYDGPFIPDSQVPPIWGPEFFGNVIVVNGRVWPYLEVEPRLYRFRLLNASDARTVMLSFGNAKVEFKQIGGDGGFRPDAPLASQLLTIGPAERYDVLVDFSGLKVGTRFVLLNSGPDEAWGGPDADPPQDPADPDTTGQVMQFRVVAGTGSGTAGAVPASLPPRAGLWPTKPARDLLLAELQVPGEFPYHVRLGTVALGPLSWSATATEVIELNATEVWRVANTTDDAHPIHLHLIDFQLVDRTPFDVDRFRAAESAWLARTGPEPELDAFVTGPATPPAPSELGPKDTVMMLPGTITRIVARFDRAGSYVWHCHIIEHEDNEMMRPMVIVP